MRKTLLFILALTSVMQLIARDFLPVLKDGKEWVYFYTNGLYEMNFLYCLDGDTVINGEHGYKLFMKYVDQQTGQALSGDYGLIGAATEKDGCAYVVLSGNRQLLYDMNMKEGDITPDNRWCVTASDDLYVGGRTLKRLTLQATEHRAEGQPATMYWVEGVGSSWGRGYMPLVVCREGGCCVFTSVQFTGLPTSRTEPDPVGNLLEDGKEWWYHDEYSRFVDLPMEFRLFVDGDTIVGNKTWKKLYHDHTPQAAPTFLTALREENGRVYELTSAGSSRLMYDFTLQVGERYTSVGGNDSYMEVITTDTVLSAGHAYRRLILQQHVNGADTDLTCWVEGIGSGFGIGANVIWSNDPMGSMLIQSTKNCQFLGCLSASGQLLYGLPPENLTAIAVRMSQKVPQSSALYDLQGRRLTDKPQRGLYIQGGRKVLVNDGPSTAW